MRPGRDATKRTDEEHQAIAERKSAARMAVIDSLSPDHRKLVHEYSYYVVKAFMDVGVTKPRHIRHLVETVLDEFSPTRGGRSHQGRSTLPVSSPDRSGDA